ncbi:MAG: SpaA isopeptide-forming pilin-related protein [Caulobacter sp.]|nr:SpaA isopeptide-forming pilin-related protein [Caulobacter sp.]
MTRLCATALASLALAMPAAAATAASPASPVALPPTAQSCTLVELMIVVALYDSSGKLVGRTTSDRNGRFTFKGLTPGTYRFTLSGDSLTRAISKGGPEWGDRPGIIAILVGLLLPAGRLEPVGSHEAPLVGSRSGAGGGGHDVWIQVQDISFTMRLPAPAGSGALKPGQTFDYQGTLSLRAR